MPEFPAVSHVALTVTDLGRSRPWYHRLFGSDPLIDEDTGPFHHVVWLLGGNLVALNQFPDLKSSEPFDERRPGLDHRQGRRAHPRRQESPAGAGQRRRTRLAHGRRRVGRTRRGSALRHPDPQPTALAARLSS